ncbi:MAG: hypothetical protein EXS59_01750 [Candidatus Taylorbacteria bacterium]|nr:hypothetical protein [Candidatus Taylorbacteria bacterium]
MRTIRLLFVDDPDWICFIGDRENRHPSESRFDPKRLLADEDLDIVPGVRLEVIEAFAGAKRCSCYDPDPVLCEKIKTMTANREVDIVVIGNNRGAGLEKAKAIAQHLQDQTIVTFFDKPHEGMTREYVEMGFKHFCIRRDLRQRLQTMLGNPS